MATDKILITGATGNTGSGIAHALLEQGRPVRVVVRDPQRSQALKEGGAEIVVADLDNPSTLRPAMFDDVGAVYLVTWNGPTAPGQVSNFLGALKASGADPRIVRRSAFGSPKSRIVRDIQTMDDMVKRSGHRWTMIQPTFFMQNLLMSVPTVKEQGTVYFDWGAGKDGMVDVRDIVDSAVGAINADDGSMDGATFVLTGPSPVGFADVAEDLSAALARPVRYVPVPHEVAVQSMVGMGMNKWVAQGYGEPLPGTIAGTAVMFELNIPLG